MVLLVATHWRSREVLATDGMRLHGPTSADDTRPAKLSRTQTRTQVHHGVPSAKLVLPSVEPGQPFQNMQPLYAVLVTHLLPPYL